MKPERWKQIEKLYDTASKLEESGRAAFLDLACGGDEELRRDLASLLASDAQAGSFLARTAAEVMARSIAAEIVPSPIGRQIGHYQVQSLLGAGGMGEIYLAEDTQLGRKVAIKLLPVKFTADSSRVRRFAQEARAASALNHPNIITIHEIGEASTENGATHYIVTEYVEGETLRQRMLRARQQRIEASEGIDIALQIAAALSAAHEAGIMHRDIKPENVMMRRDGIVKVLDFGLAKLTEPSSPVIDTQASTRVRYSTEAGVVMGTPRYMSPEQTRGEKVDARTDIFSLGVMLYEMVTGRAPFAGATTGEVIAAILRDKPPPLAEYAPDAPPEMERILSKALRKDREERYQTVNELLADLKRLKRRLEQMDGLQDELARAVRPASEYEVSASGEAMLPGATLKQARSTGAVQADLLTNPVANQQPLVFPVSWAYAILNRRIYDVSFVIRRRVQYLLAKNALRLLLALPLVGLTLIVYADRDRTLADLLFHNSVWSYASLLAAVALGLAYRHNLREWLDRRFFREAYQQDKVLRELIEEVRRLDSLTEMARRVSQKVDAALHPERLYLFYREEGRRDLSLGYSTGESSPDLRIPYEFELLRFLKYQGGAQNFPFPAKTRLPPQEKKWLASLGASLIVPMHGTDDRLKGLLVLGPKKSEIPYTGSDRQLLEMLADQIALVYENAQLKERVTRDCCVQHEV